MTKLLLTLLSILLFAGAGVAFQTKSPLEQATTAKEAKVEEAKVVAAQGPSYPADTCLVTDKPLDSMGGVINFVHEGRLVRFCCAGCIKRYKKKAATYNVKLDLQVKAAQGPSYPLKTCPLTGEPLGEKPAELVFGTKLVRVCCRTCARKTKIKPEPVLAKVDAAWIAAQKADYPLTTCLVDDRPLAPGIDYLHGVTLTRFSSQEALAKFKQEPEKYLPKLRRGKTPSSEGR